MHVIVVYDISIERVNDIKKLLKKYLNWVQNSVFEGELTLGRMKELEIDIGKVIDKENDSVILYSINNPIWIKKKIIGKEKATTENII